MVTLVAGNSAAEVFTYLEIGVSSGRRHAPSLRSLDISDWRVARQLNAGSNVIR
jgi:hypothetical protein